MAEMTENSSKLLDQLTDEYNRLKGQKSRNTGGLEARVLLNLGFVLGEQHISHKENAIYMEKQDPNKLYLVFNLIAPRFNKLLGRLSSLGMVFKAQPDKQDPKALAEAEVVDALDNALDQKLTQPSRFWETLWWMGVGGTAFIYTPWIPDATLEPAPVMAEDGQTPLFIEKASGNQLTAEQVQSAVASGAPPEMFDLYEEVQRVGEVGCEVLGPLNVFIDQSVRSVADLAPDQWVFVAKIRTVGWVQETFDKKVEPDRDFQIVTTQFHQLGSAVGGQFLKDLIPLVQGSNSEKDPQMVTVIEAYQPSSKSNPRGRYVVFVPGKGILHDSPNPYEEIPLVDFHWKPVTVNFWTSDYITDLIAPQRFINKRVSQLGEQSNATLYSQLLLGGALTEKDIPADFPGTIPGGLTPEGIPMVARLSPPELPNWFIPSLDRAIQMFNDVAGGADLLEEKKFPGQLRGPMAVPMLQEIIDTEWGPLYAHIGERMARVKQQRLNRVKQFYPESRTLHYVSKDMKDETMTFHKEKILGSGTNYNITVERGSLLPELRALREERLMTRLNGPLSILYIDERTGMLDKSKIAADLKFGDAGRESREAKYRKLGMEIVDMLWAGQQAPPVMPFYDHRSMLDELESAMATTEFIRASQPIQMLFINRYEEHRKYIMEEAMAQQQQMQSGAVQNAVAMATQQAAAQAAAMAVEQAMGTAKAAQDQPTEQIVAQEKAAAGSTKR